MLAAHRVEPALFERPERWDVTHTHLVPRTLRDWVSGAVAAIVFLSLWMGPMRRFADRHCRRGFMTVGTGKGKGKFHIQTGTGVPFAGVAGVDEVRQKLEDLVGFLRHPQAWSLLRAHTPKSVLLVGAQAAGRMLSATASDIACIMVSRRGMDEALGCVAREAPRSAMLVEPAIRTLAAGLRHA